MGLFDKFRKKVQHAASEVDADSLSAEEGTDEANEALGQLQEIETTSNTHQEDEWEELDENEVLELPTESPEDWDEWDEEEEYTLPTKLTRKEKKVLAKQAKKESKQRKVNAKQLKKRGGKEVSRLAGSKLSLIHI